MMQLKCIRSSLRQRLIVLYALPLGSPVSIQTSFESKLDSLSQARECEREERAVLFDCDKSFESVLSQTLLE